MVNEQLLEAYQSHVDGLGRLGPAIEAELRSMLETHGVKIHSVRFRVKDRESLRRKISRPDKTYCSLWEVTDLLGLRVITYFEDSIDTVARLVEERYCVDFVNSQDKRGFHDNHRFGYRSLHYICGLPANRADSLPPEAKFEIQVRTVLQHAWAEIEHDLGYKVNDTIPEPIRRRFSRIASLLEIADEEFVSIRRALDDYMIKVETSVLDPTRSLPLDRLSLPSFLESPEIQEADRRIAEQLGKPLGDDIFFPEYLLKMLRLAGLRDTAAVQQALVVHGERMTAFVRPYFAFAQETWKLNSAQMVSVFRGYSLFFLSHIVVLESGLLDLSKVEKLAQFYQALDYPHNERAAHEVAIGLLQHLKSVTAG
jgi:putative GTP pyrophosphokinase